MLWELRDGATRPFGELRERCDGMSTSVLRDRLVELADAGLVEQDDAGAYALTRQGRSLVGVLAPLGPWASRWGRAR